MPLDVFDLCAFFKVKSMHAVVLGIAACIVVYAAPRDDGNVCAFPNEKVIIYRFFEIAYRKQYGYMHRFFDDARFDDDIDAVLILFRDYLDVGSRISRQQFPVFADIETALGNIVQPRDGLQKFGICPVHTLTLL